MEKEKAKATGAVRNRNNEVHCPNCGRIIAKGVPGNNATIRCAPCKGDVEFSFTDLVLNMRMKFREA